MTRTEVSGEQVILAWSSSNLLGISGMGPVAASPGWPLDTDTFAGLGEAGRYLPAGAAAELDPDVVLPTCLEFRPNASGCLLLAKVYSRQSRRPGQYQVHAIRTGPGLSSWDLWELAGDALHEDELTDFPAELAKLSISPCLPPRIHPDLDDVGPLARLLQCIVQQQPFLISCSDQAAGTEAIGTLLCYLPRAVAQQVPVSTFVSSSQLWPLGIGLMIPGVSLDAPTPDLELDDYDFVEAPAQFQRLAELFVRGEGETLNSLADIQAWLSFDSGELETLSAAELGALLEGPMFAGALAKLAQDPASGSLLRRLRTDSAAESKLASRLHSEAAEQTEVIATLIRGLGEQNSTIAGPLQTWVVDAVGQAHWRELLSALLLESRRQGVRVHSAALATVIGQDCQPEDLDGFTFTAAPTVWSSVSEAEFGRCLLDSRPMSPESRELIRQHPELAADFLDRQLVAHRWTLGRVGRAIERCPDSELDRLISVLLRSEQIPDNWAVRTLASRSPEVARDILAEQWPAIAEQLGIPSQVAELLTVRKAGWWRGR